jgi:predicted lipid-binding transport protein (Tim44 family)
MSDSFDIYTLIFLGLAIFVFVRLRSVLGTRTGHERPPADSYAQRESTPPASANENAVAMPKRDVQAEAAAPSSAQRSWNNAVEEGSMAAEGLKAIAEADKDFDTTTFLKNASTAYEMIVSAFGAGDRDFLKDLLSPEVMEDFAEAIAQREARGEKTDTDFVSVRAEKIHHASLEGTLASITVKFRSDAVTVVRNAAGDIVEGAPDRVEEIHDVWTFARDLASPSPVWKLVATEA